MLFRSAIVCSSSGNHGLACAWTGRNLGIPCHVFVSEAVGPAKRAVIASLGGTVHVAGRDIDDAREAAMRELGAQHAPRIWANLRHFHNEYLNAWFDHGMIGLGAGAMSTYSRTGDHLTFYEIDPMVVSIAQNPDYFTYWHQAKGEKKIVLGDARLSLTHTPDQHYDVLVVDAFSSDAIPVHLMTQQGIDLFLKKTKPTGAILIHISNRYLDLKKVIANYTLPAGYASYCGSHGLDNGGTLKNDFKYPHIVCLIAQTETLPPIIKTNPSWKKTTPDPTFRSWTDDFSNIFNVFHL